MGDRSSPVRLGGGRRAEVRDRARMRVHAILDSHYPGHIDAEVDARIRGAFEILLPGKALSLGRRRW